MILRIWKHDKIKVMKMEFTITYSRLYLSRLCVKTKWSDLKTKMQIWSANTKMSFIICIFFMIKWDNYSYKYKIKSKQDYSRTLHRLRYVDVHPIVRPSLSSFCARNMLNPATRFLWIFHPHISKTAYIYTLSIA